MTVEVKGTMSHRWQEISETLREAMASGRYPRGSRLPTEAKLADSFAVNRHTVRRALKALRDTGLVEPRQGSGVFVTGQPRTYRLSKRTRFSQSLEGQGQNLAMTVLGIEQRRASAGERQRFGVADRRVLMVHAALGVRSLDGQPVALFRSLIPTAMVPAFPEMLHQTGSITRALAACGIPDYTRSSTSLTAVAASAAQARHLECRRDDPLLQSDAVNITPDERVVEVGTSWFRGDSIRLVID
jgi:GntR family phosphonate transport system transcriptional regulator